MTTKNNLKGSAVIKKKSRKAGRPSRYTDALVNELCLRLVEGKSLNKVCKSNDMPGIRTVFTWLSDEKYIEFRHKYERACELRSELGADEIREIADGGAGFDDNTKIARDRLRIDARKWIAARLLPKKYGDRFQQDLTHDIKETSNVRELLLDNVERVRERVERFRVAQKDSHE